VREDGDDPRAAADDPVVGLGGVGRAGLAAQVAGGLSVRISSDPTPSQLHKNLHATSASHFGMFLKD
jgi:hypothetical protein